ncbi:MAG: ABC transporter permease [Anaerolineales bacterium]
MNMLNNILAVAWKELQLIARDRGALAIFFLLPLLLSTIQGGANAVANSEEAAAAILLNVQLVNEDAGDFGREVVNAIENIDELAIASPATVEDAEESVRQGEAAAAIVIPADFSASIDAYEPTEIEVIVDPAEPESASIVSGIMNQVVAEVTIWGEVQYGIRSVFDKSGLLGDLNAEQRRGIEAQNLGVIMTSLNELRQDPSILVVNESLEGEEVDAGTNDFFAYMYPAYTVMFIFFVIGTCATSVLREREAGTLRRLVASPIPRGAVIGGKMLAFMVIPCLQTIVLLGVAHVFFDTPLGQHPLALIVLTVIVAAVATSMGLLMATIAKSVSQADSLGTMASFVLAAIGGAIPVAPLLLTRAEGFISILTRFTPHAHAIEAYYSIMAENAGLVDVLPEIGFLVGMGVIYFVIAVRRFKFE